MNAPPYFSTIAEIAARLSSSGFFKIQREQRLSIFLKIKNFIVTHTLKSDEAMDAYFQALETMSEADIRGAMKNEKASF